MLCGQETQEAHHCQLKMTHPLEPENNTELEKIEAKQNWTSSMDFKHSPH